MGIGSVKGNTVVAINEEATAATGTIQITNNTFDSGDAVTVNGVAFTEGTEWSAGASIADSTDNLAAAINASDNFLVNGVLRASSDNVDTITITADIPGTAGNAITLAETDNATDNFTLSGSTLSGGANSEGTAVAPAAASDFIQVQEEGLEQNPAKETVERGTLTDSIGKVTPRTSTKSGSGALQVEFKASGTEGGVPEYDVLLRSAMGNRRRLNNRITTGSSHTTSVLNITDADDKFKVGDFIVILESGDHSSHFVSAVAASSITYVPARDSAPSDSVVLAKSVTYFPANIAHPAFTKNIYWGDDIREQGIGSRITSMAVESFATGQIPLLNFAHDDLSFSRIVGSAAFTPSLDAGLPPLALNVKFFRGTDCIDINELGISLENAVSFLTSVKSANGRLQSRVAERTISGNINPYMEDDDVDIFTDFDEDNLFSMIATAQNLSSTAGEFDLGSCIGIYCPNVLITEDPIADTDGILIENVSLSINRGTAGDQEEIYVGFC